MAFADHLIIAPIVLPLIIGAALMLIDDRRRPLKATLSVATTVALLVLALALLQRASGLTTMPETASYALGNWPAPFGIVLVLDRLSAMMLLLTSILGLSALVFSLARWHRAGPNFHTLFLFLIMGLNGAFLTGDLFNLFVFFEVLLAASYGLVLHGMGAVRVKAGLHYIVVNLAASTLFLIGVSLIYGASGTLNMADLALRIPGMGDEDRMFLEAGAAILGVAFLVKAGMWPLSFWLPTAYAAACAPVAAIFAIMTKVGVYILLRLSLLLFGNGAGESAHFGTEVLLYGGMATIAFGAIGVLATQTMSRLAGYSVLVSSGTVLATIGVGNAAATSGALFYLVNSTLAISGFFLLIELVERGRDPGADVLAVTMEAFGYTDEDDVTEEVEVGARIPTILAFLGGSFIACAVLIAGLPPLSGFIAKFALLSAILDPAGIGTGGPQYIVTWVLIALLILSGLSAMLAMTRIGIQTFWSSIEGAVPGVRGVEIAGVAFLLLLCVGMTVRAGPILDFMEKTALSLHAPTQYIHSVIPAHAEAAKHQRRAK
ncbi:monovalent cation/H+ antiporter subunit D [Pseudochelatococcus sp. G4_1912]|uniref:monovalent cation/H+ antiporter subunit D n=1 Tax=Pseudochelatococcus sp. G4_1912 TaxID=3114288 RepID=UPI0039C5C84C